MFLLTKKRTMSFIKCSWQFKPHENKWILLSTYFGFLSQPGFDKNWNRRADFTRYKGTGP